MSLNVNSNFTPNYPNLTVSGAITSASAQITTLTASNIAITNNLSVAGTLTTVNMTTTNLIDTNITAGSANITNATIATARITSNLLALGNSNTLGNLFTTGGNVGIGTTSPAQILDIRATNLNLAFGQNLNQKIQIGGNQGSVGNYEGIYGGYIEGGVNFGTGVYLALGNNYNGVYNEVLRVYNNGYVGIGTTTPSYPLHVASSVNGTFSYGYLNNAGRVGTDNASIPVGIYASQRIVCAEFDAVSDERIKTNIRDITNAHDLLTQIKSRKYGFQDKLRHGSNETYGFIGQELKEIVPEAVNYQTETIPNIMKLAKVIEHDIIELETSEDILNKKVRLYVSKDEKEETLDCKVIEKLSDNQFRVDTSLQTSEVFVYGTEIDDFHDVNYQSIIPILVSGYQHQQKEIESLESKIDALAARLAALEQK